MGFVIVCLNKYLANNCSLVPIVSTDLFRRFNFDVCGCSLALVARSLVMMLLAASSYYCTTSVSQRSSPAMVVGSASSPSQVQSNPAVVVDSASSSSHALPMAPYVSQSFAELSDSLGFIAGERVGDMIRDAVVMVLGPDGDSFLDSGWLLQWEGWAHLRETLLMHETAVDHSDTDTVFAAISCHVRLLLKIASDNEDVPLKSDASRLQELEQTGLKLGTGLVYGRNDCLADSLLQCMVAAGIFHGNIAVADRDATNVQCKYQHVCQL